MTGYTITIAPDTEEAGSQTTIRVDTASGQPRITELTVRAANGLGLGPGQLPAIDLGALVAALAPPGTAAITAEAYPSASHPAASSAGAGRGAAAETEAASAATTRRARRAEGSTGRRAPAKRTPARGAAKAAKAAAATAAEETGAAETTTATARGRGTARKASARKAAKSSTGRRPSGATNGSGAAESRTGSRAYRRMPEPSEVLDAYRQASTVNAVAEHFGVPRHTVTGWLRRLRRLGMLEAKS
jgi:hypothetical protein